MFVKVLAFLAVIGLVTADTANLNQLADQLLASLQQLIQQEGKDVVVIPDFSKEWHQRKHFIRITESVNCHDGSFRSLASIRRTGDVTMTTQGNQVILQLKLGLGTLDAKFGRCQAKIHRIGSTSSKLDISVNGNSIDAQISLTGQGASCVAKIDRLELNQLGRISIHTGGGIFHKIEDKILDHVAKMFHGTVINQANNFLHDAAARALPKADLCNKIPH